MSSIAHLFALSVGLSIPGCGDENAAVSKVHPVTGKVLLADGRPLTSGRVVFVSKKGSISVEGKVEADGTFKLDAGSSGPGAPEGDYKVRIEVDETRQPSSKGKLSRRTGPSPFPPRYAEEDSSGLTATVKPGENNLPPFTLDKQ